MIELNRLRRLHYVSGLTIATFAFWHLGNHLFSLCGAENHIELMQIFRIVYRNVFVEIVLLMAVVVQICSGVSLFLYKRKMQIFGFEKLQIYTGLYLALFFVIHVSAVLVGRLILNLDTNFYFGAAGLNSFPVNLFFIPYYGLAVMAFFSHIAAIHASKMKQNFLGLNPRNQSFVIIVLGFLITFLILFGMTNAFRGIDIPADYLILTGKL